MRSFHSRPTQARPATHWPGFERARSAGHRYAMAAMCVAIGSFVSCRSETAPPATSNEDEPIAEIAEAKPTDESPLDTAVDRPDATAVDARKLFDGISLAGWESTPFGGEGEIKAEEGRIVLGFGEPMTGITWTQDIPKTNYEVQLEAMRVDGIDFFCGMTFPVGDAPCSLILGGWGGTVVGLSSIDGMDASENETTQYLRFENGRWYSIRLRVTEAKIEAWIDEEPVVEVDRDKRSFSIRSEVELSQPFGIASFQTTAALRNITLRQVQEDGRETDQAPP